jgi:pimeloyl-ACP methyl ester carboxylesterase
LIETVASVGEYAPPYESPEINWSEHEHDLTIDGRCVRYVDIGSGPLGFVLVHGMGGCWQHWSPTLPFLARHGRVLALDLPGFARSEPPAGGVSLEGFADVAAQLCEAVGVHQVAFLGHSMGGPIALRFASRHPDLARAVVMVCGAVRTFSAVLGRRDLWLHARQRPRETAAIITEIGAAGLPAPRTLGRLVANHPLLRRLVLWPYLQRPDAFSAEAAALLLQGAGAPGVFPTARAIGRSEPYEGLADVRCPILSIGARHDLICPPADLHEFDRIAPVATSVLIEGAGHMVMLERPQEFNDRVGQFLLC